MSLTRRMLNEPLFQFLVAGVVLFGAYSALNRTPDAQQTELVQVSQGRVEQLAQIFSRTWQRPPTRDELTGLVDAFVKEEIFYREGRKLGLDADDTVFRRRLQQKMEFLMEPDETELTPTEDVLEAYLAEYSARFRVEERAAFEQIYFDSSRRGDGAEHSARAVLVSLNDNDDTSAIEAGDPTLLPQSMRLTSIQQIKATFGTGFAQELASLPVGEWAGPIRSEYGLHLVNVAVFEPARAPELAEIRDEVLREWRDEKRRDIAEQRYRELRNQYRVVVDWPKQLSDTGEDN